MAEKTLRFETRADEATAAKVADELGRHVAARFGPRDEAPLHVFAYDGAKLVGGLNGVTHWRWLYVRQLWVENEHRGKGLGADLLTRAEAQARARDCLGAYIDTFEAEVAAFYERRGFIRFGAIDDFPPGARRIFLVRRF